MKESVCYDELAHGPSSAQMMAQEPTRDMCRARDWRTCASARKLCSAHLLAHDTAGMDDEEAQSNLIAAGRWDRHTDFLEIRNTRVSERLTTQSAHEQVLLLVNLQAQVADHDDEVSEIMAGRDSGG